MTTAHSFIDASYIIHSPNVGIIYLNGLLSDEDLSYITAKYQELGNVRDGMYEFLLKEEAKIEKVLRKGLKKNLELEIDRVRCIRRTYRAETDKMFYRLKVDILNYAVRYNPHVVILW